MISYPLGRWLPRPWRAMRRLGGASELIQGGGCQRHFPKVDAVGQTDRKADMGLPIASYFFALAALSMAFVGFTSVVVVLYQGTGKQLSPFHILLTRLFVELGLMATAFAMLAPTLAICGTRIDLVWRISSTIMLITLLPWLIYYPLRRKKAVPDDRLPLRWYVMSSIGLASVILLFLNAIGWMIAPGPAPLVIATVFVLSYATVAYIGTYSLFTRS